MDLRMRHTDITFVCAHTILPVYLHIENLHTYFAK